MFLITHLPFSQISWSLSCCPSILFKIARILIEISTNERPASYFSQPIRSSFTIGRQPLSQPCSFLSKFLKKIWGQKRKVLPYVLECKAWLKSPPRQSDFWHRYKCSIAKKLLDSKTSSSKVSNKEKKTYNHCKTSHISLILGRRKSFHLVIYIRIWQLRTITGLQV